MDAERYLGVFMDARDILSKLERGGLRAAEKKDGVWRANAEVKAAILAVFKEEQMIDYGDGFIDKAALAPRRFSLAAGIRIVPGGSSIRAGAYIGKGTIIMPPSFINVGAFVDEGSMVDSHVLVGSCAQIGKRVHLSAGVQIGGVLEPIGTTPVVIEDDAFIGAGAIIVEGRQISQGAVIAPGVKLSRATPVFDCIRERIVQPDEAIPERAVIVPGSRPIAGHLSWAIHQGLALDCAIIIKYRDQKTDAALELENVLRC
jgi:2,3,4,5-tetrahydropyridine-2-carboxylate N-succinyltransferase